MNYTYIVQCSDGTYYTGWTNDLEKRIKSHNAGTGAKYTRPVFRLPLFIMRLLLQSKKQCAENMPLNIFPVIKKNI